MKKVILSLLLIGFCLTSFARDWRTDKGYSGNIAVAASVGTDILVSDNVILYGCETNHGYAFGNRWYFGGGAGIDFLSEESFFRSVIHGSALCNSGFSSICFWTGRSSVQQGVRS